MKIGILFRKKLGKCEICLAKTKGFIDTPYGNMYLCKVHREDNND